MWTAKVEEPFRDDPRFWASVGASIDALLALVAAGVLLVAFPGWSAVAFAVPVLLLVVAWRRGRASSGATRRHFATHEEWRDRERAAVAAAIPGAFTRRRFRAAR